MLERWFSFHPQQKNAVGGRSPTCSIMPHISSLQLSSLGFSGIKMKSAPVATPAIRASHPQCRPMTSTTKAREWDEAVASIRSTALQILCSAEWQPMVESVPERSLSIEPTRPTMLRCLNGWSWLAVNSPLDSSSSSSDGHSARNLSAPVSEPSPPQIMRALMPSRMRFLAAARRPARSKKAMQRAVPMSVPPSDSQPRTSFHSILRMRSPPPTRPSYPS